MKGLSVKFNGVELNEYLTVTDSFSPFGGADWGPSTITLGDLANGADFSGTKYGSKTIKMPFAISGDVETKYHALQKALNVDEPCQLIFGFNEGVYYNAVPSGTLDYSTVNKDTGTGTITWLVPDGLAHATTLTSFTAAENSDGILEVTITNNGTVSVPISYTITHNDENGYIGVVSDEGAIQLGNIAEADGEDYTQNETILTSSSPKVFNPSGWYADTGRLSWDTSVDTSGTLKVSGGKLVLSTLPGEKWLSGGMWSYDVVDSNGDAGALNFYAYINSWFALGKPGQTGAQVFAFVDEDDALICAQIIYKNSTSGSDAHTSFYVARNVTGTVRQKTIDFSAQDSWPPNPYVDGQGHASMRKEDADITFYFGGTTYKYHVPAVSGVKVHKVQLFIGQYKGRGTGAAQYATGNAFRRIGLQIMGVDKWRDVPNRYQSGDEVYIDGEAAKVYVNGMENTGDEVTGSTYFLAQPGETTVRFYYSDFCESAPTVTAQIREAWL